MNSICDIVALVIRITQNERSRRRRWSLHTSSYDGGRITSRIRAGITVNMAARLATCHYCCHEPLIFMSMVLKYGECYYHGRESGTAVGGDMLVAHCWYVIYGYHYAVIQLVITVTIMLLVTTTGEARRERHTITATPRELCLFVDRYRVTARHEQATYIYITRMVTLAGITVLLLLRANTMAIDIVVMESRNAWLRCARRCHITVVGDEMAR